MTFGVVGMALTALGTILAIVHPSIGAVWSGGDTKRKELTLQIRYYIGILLILIGTAIQIYDGWK